VVACPYQRIDLKISSEGVEVQGNKSTCHLQEQQLYQPMHTPLNNKYIQPIRTPLNNNAIKEVLLDRKQSNKGETDKGRHSWQKQKKNAKYPLRCLGTGEQK
jgi:hypothetical protein